MKKFKNYLIIFLILSILFFSFNSYYSTKNIDSLAYVIAIGFDKGDQSKLKLTFQIVLPSNSEKSNSSSQSSQTSSVSIECDSMDLGISLLDSYLNKKSNLAHCKSIVFSERLASEGISEYIYTLINNIEIRSNINILVCKNNTEYFLKNSYPSLQDFAANYYESVIISNDYTGYTEDIELKDFFSSINYNYSSAYAVLGAININSVSSANSTNSYLAGYTPINAQNNFENVGIAVFHKDKLIGELDSLENICHMIISNELEDCSLSIPYINDIVKTIDIDLTLTKNTQNKIHIINNSPYITSNIYLTGRIFSLDNDSNYLQNDLQNQIKQSSEKYIENLIKNYLYKTSKEFNSDIDNFSNKAVKKFTFWNNWENYNWEQNYRNSFFDVNVNLDLKSSYILLNT